MADILRSHGLEEAAGTAAREPQDAATLSPSVDDHAAVMRYLAQIPVDPSAELLTDLRAFDGRRRLQVSHLEQRILDNLGDGLVRRPPGWRCSGDTCTREHHQSVVLDASGVPVWINL